MSKIVRWTIILQTLELFNINSIRMMYMYIDRIILKYSHISNFQIEAADNIWHLLFKLFNNKTQISRIIKVYTQEKKTNTSHWQTQHKNYGNIEDRRLTTVIVVVDERERGTRLHICLFVCLFVSTINNVNWHLCQNPIEDLCESDAPDDWFPHGPINCAWHLSWDPREIYTFDQ